MIVVDPAAAAEKLAAQQVKYAADKDRRFGKWTVIDPFAGRDRDRSRLVLVRCACGSEKAVRFKDLNRGKSGQCHECHSRQLVEYTNSPENRARLAEMNRSPEARARSASPENIARLTELARSPENRARAAELMSEWNSSPEGQASRSEWNSSPEHLAQLARLHEEWSRSEENRARVAEMLISEARSPEGRARRSEMARTPENLARLAAASRSPECRARQAEWASSPENLARLAELMAEINSIPRMGSYLEPVYACSDCGDGNGRILAFRSAEEEAAHFAGWPHNRRSKRADAGVLAVECKRPVGPEVNR